MTLQLFSGIILGITAALVAWFVGILSRSGAWSAALVGSVVFGFGGWEWAVLMLAFFTSSSILSRAYARRKSVLSQKSSKGSRRDWGQVLANGGLAALIVIMNWIFSSEGDRISPALIDSMAWVAYAGVISAVTADTWGTELGALSKSPPRKITTREQVENGTSGAVSLVGSLASAGGAMLIGLLAAVFYHEMFGQLISGWSVFISVWIGGLTGSIFDSILGAEYQAIYFCPKCMLETEQHPAHSCGSSTSIIRGNSWLNNDLVNFLASLVGALVSSAIYLILS